MRSPSDCLESIQNGEHEKYPYTQAVLNLIDSDELEGRLRSIAQAAELNHVGNLNDFALSLGRAINDVMEDQAQAMSQASVTPLDNDTNESDVRREQ